MAKLLREVWGKKGMDSIEVGMLASLILMLASFPVVMAWGVVEEVSNVPYAKTGLGFEVTHLILPAAGIGMLVGSLYFGVFLILAIISHLKNRLAQTVDQTMDEEDTTTDWQHKVA